MNPSLITVTLARKPLGEATVASNVIRYGTGALNIDGTRIPFGEDEDTGPDRVQRQQASGGNTSVKGAFGAESLVGREIPTYKEGGRWPANMLLQHLEGCTPAVCQPQCAVLDIDRQAPGSARFFKQMPHSAALSPDLLEYLHDLITPSAATTGASAGVCYTSDTIDDAWLETAPDQSCHALIMRGEPSAVAAAHMARVLLPGGHLCLVAPDECPTGHRGACAVEDAGFEIRDSILWVRDAGATHYVPKPGKAEREAGVGHLAGQRAQPRYYPVNEDARVALSDAGIDDDMADAGLLSLDAVDESLHPLFVHKVVVTGRGNSHPTVKPKDVMIRLLANVPKDQGPVLDPFLGSGTTLVACLETGHDGIGIEREAEYIEIADARVRHWDAAKAGWDAAKIVSDFKPESSDDGALDLADLLGL
jgi:hypothetical protein